MKEPSSTGRGEPPPSDDADTVARFEAALAAGDLEGAGEHAYELWESRCQQALAGLGPPQRVADLTAWAAEPLTTLIVALNRRPRVEAMAANFFVWEDSLDEIRRLLNSCREEVWLWGTTMSRDVHFLDAYLEQALGRGVRVKALLIQRRSASVPMAAFRAGAQFTEDYVNATLEDTLRVLTGVGERAGDGLEVRLVNYLAPYTLYAYDPELPHGRMDVRLGSFHGEHDRRPTFTLSAARDGEWYRYFCDQFHWVWEAADRLPPGAG